MKVWIRDRSAGASARAASSMSWAPAPRQRRDHRAPHLARDLPHRFGVGRRGDRKARLDDVHAERVEGAGERHLRGDVHREAGRLLAVPEGGVEHDDARGGIAHVCSCSRRQA